MVWAWVRAANTADLQFTVAMNAKTMKQRMISPLWELGHRTVLQHDNKPKKRLKADQCLAKEVEV